MDCSPVRMINNDSDKHNDRYKARRTKAMPKHTLFGAGLEILDKEQIENMKKIDGRKFEQEELEVNKKPQKVLPAAYKAHLPGIYFKNIPLCRWW